MRDRREPGPPPAADPVVAILVRTMAGTVAVAATTRGIVALDADASVESFEAALGRRGRGPVHWLADDDPWPPALRAVHELLAPTLGGDPEAAAELMNVPLDLSDRPAWDRAVLGAVRSIPRGQVRSYGAVAAAVGRPGAARAVGGAVGRNPVDILVPCHRVVAGDGTLGGYGGGWWGDREERLQTKAARLASEGVTLPRRPAAVRRRP